MGCQIGTAKAALLEVIKNAQERRKLYRKRTILFVKQVLETPNWGPYEYHKVFDEMRMHVVADLATPEFREEVDRRLEAILDRLMATEDIKKLELVLFLIPLLSMKEVPWGLCGLILALDHRTMQKTMQEYEEEEEEEVYGELLDEIKSESGDEVDLVKLRERHKWAAALQAELSWLDDAEYEETSSY